MVECESAFCVAMSIDNAGFNRYMVECEFRCMDNRLRAHRVLIDTWWNVNSELVSQLEYIHEF